MKTRNEFFEWNECSERFGGYLHWINLFFCIHECIQITSNWERLLSQPETDSCLLVCKSVASKSSLNLEVWSIFRISVQIAASLKLRLGLIWRKRRNQRVTGPLPRNKKKSLEGPPTRWTCTSSRSLRERGLPHRTQVARHRAEQLLSTLGQHLLMTIEVWV